MADRALLSVYKIIEFKEWLQSKGYTLYEPRGYFEAIRARKDGEWLIVFYRFNMSEHLSVRDKDKKIVRQFIRERREVNKNAG